MSGKHGEGDLELCKDEKGPETEDPSLTAVKMRDTGTADDTSSFSQPMVMPESAPTASSDVIKKEQLSDTIKSGTSASPVTSTRTDPTGKNVKCLDNPSSELKQPPAAGHCNQGAVLGYKEPDWGGLCPLPYYFEVIKNGTVIDTLKLTEKSFYVFGRLPQCDVTMEHPSLSRFHAVVQHCVEPAFRHEKGWHLFDLESTHGTFLNKIKVLPRRYVRLRVGHVVKFAGSSRLYVLQGPCDDQEEEIDIQEVKAAAKKRKEAKDEDGGNDKGDKDNKDDDAKKKDEGASGCLWGMVEDAVDTTTINPFSLSQPQHEDLYIDDPKKALKGFFEREGFDQPEYIADELSHGKHHCKVELPLDATAGGVVWAEASVVGKKREAVVACALEACRILDKNGLLRKATHESRKRKEKNWADEDYYGSDEDTYFDRTGDIEERRQARMKRFSRKTRIAETYDSLRKQLEAVQNEIAEKDRLLQEDKERRSKAEKEEVDELDAYMLSIKTGAMDTKTKIQLKQQLFKLRQDEKRLEKLVRIAQPATLPNLNKLSKSLPLFGKRKTSSPRVPKPQPQTSRVPVAAGDSGEEEEEEEEEEEDEEETVKEKKNENAKSQKKDVDSEKTEPVKPVSLSKVSPQSKSQHTDNEKTLTCDKETISQVSEKGGDTTSFGKCPEIKTRILGPAMPPVPSEMEVSPDKSNCPGIEEDNTTEKSSPEKAEGITEWAVAEKEEKRKKNSGRQRKRKFKDTDVAQPLTSDSKVDMWLPPTGQTGDGKTHLNDKFGY